MADRARALAFWSDLLGLTPEDHPGDEVVLSAHGEPLLRLEVRPSAPPRPPDATGLFHVALLLPDRASLARAFLRIEARGGRRWLVGASDHRVSEALYYRSPDGTGLELYADRPRSDWGREGGELAMGTEPLDLPALLEEAVDLPWAEDEPAIVPGTVVGHVHLQVSDLGRTGAFYRERLGMDVTVSSYPGALFLSWAGYHHHLGLNVWGAGRRSPPPEGSVGLVGWEVGAPDGLPGGAGPGDAWTDPDGVRVRVVR